MEDRGHSGRLWLAEISGLVGSFICQPRGGAGESKCDNISLGGGGKGEREQHLFPARFPTTSRDGGIEYL